MQKHNPPLVSVIMGVFNCEKTVSKSIESILDQTYPNIEFVICDDGSSDRTPQIVLDYARRFPDRIRFVENGKNMGLNYTLNRCLSLATGTYIARMDGDDISLPHRFARQVQFLEENPDVAIVGSAMDVFDENGIWGAHHYSERPTRQDFISKTAIFGHPSVMVRQEAYRAVEGYTESPRLLRVEDYHLWMKMYAKGYTGVNLPEVLYLYRDDRDSFAKRNMRCRINGTYVRMLAVKTLKLPAYGYIRAFRSVLVGLLPYGIYKKLHRHKLRRDDSNK